MIGWNVSQGGGWRGASPRFFLWQWDRIGRAGFGIPGWIFVLLIASLLAACSTAPTPASPTATQNPPISAFSIRTPTKTPTETIPRPAATFTPLPSPTPFTYTIVEGDTLLAIAFRFSLTVDDILGVNSGVDPRLLSVGTTLVIPLGEEGVGLIPTPTPAPLTTSSPDCYPSIDGGMWCFMKIKNEQAAAVEGVSGEISLYAEDGEIIASEIAILPMDRLFSGLALPLMAYFPAPAPRDQYIQGLLLGAFQVDPERARFLAAELTEVVSEYGTDRMAAQVTGRVRSQEREEGAPPGKLVVVAVAYGEGETVVGLRKWEREAGELNEPLPFELTVFSLGPPIIDVDVLAEYQPAGEILTETASP